jgi:hypothetical protein
MGQRLADSSVSLLLPRTSKLLFDLCGRGSDCVGSKEHSQLLGTRCYVLCLYVLRERCFDMVEKYRDCIIERGIVYHRQKRQGT